MMGIILTQAAPLQEKGKDEERSQWLNSQGFTVMRFWNHEILTNIDGVLESFRAQCFERPLSPALSHQGERGR
ncbi:DUF559 domain-containing protein [Geoalkalibacter sp.]|uniref:DUF559 domain-containing protein n=1 Tax=Geoalkalibacter sp. TaxID=3041440 RepID=UPI00272E02EC|nr:DUF559 domain-containing protein [Geoalkalibacter sp.]